MRRLDGAILGLLIVALLAALALISWITVGSAQRVLLPQLDRKAQAAANSVASLVGQGLELGLSLEELHGVDAVLVAAVGEAQEFTFA
jgi:cytochrome c-type biogenesis protein CcmH/NrfG